MNNLTNPEDEGGGRADSNKSSPVHISSPNISYNADTNQDFPLDSFNKFCDNININNIPGEKITNNAFTQKDAHMHTDNSDAYLLRYGKQILSTSNKKRSRDSSTALKQQKLRNLPAANTNKRHAQDLNDNNSPTISSSVLNPKLIFKYMAQDKGPFILMIISNIKSSKAHLSLFITASFNLAFNFVNDVSVLELLYNCLISEIEISGFESSINEQFPYRGGLRILVVLNILYNWRKVGTPGWSLDPAA
ncbi:hypothetical protein PUN28_017763 [Cardiocondyla obscurior]|uniref:Uncharacterized protein n=1 Tax=Cardiocondyla obscurior TaxID=286306 RepID=A0AAW2EMW7_9HYME